MTEETYKCPHSWVMLSCHELKTTVKWFPISPILYNFLNAFCPHIFGLLFVLNINLRTAKRQQTFYDGSPTSPPGVCHIPMGSPFCNKTREILLETAKTQGIKCHPKGTMITIEGPRFSSQAESLMFQQWGADVINMTTVPEVVLAREAVICYASIAMATDYDCWKKHEEAVSVDKVLKTMKGNAKKAASVLLTSIPKIATVDWTEVLKSMRVSVPSKSST
nr:PREDICTED: S-methyl-5'-thioadenosine phosphorylase-like [Latimeria chalumnae]|eukprot:XP_014353931.1 PREDICTED: S-methyl-5'-thioadenosine phosphorylase-like [Latimeria chalumnae]